MCIVTEVSHTWVQVPAWLEQDRRSAVEAALGREASRKAVAADGCGCVPLSGDVTQLAAWKAAMWPAVDHECLNQELGLLSRLAHAVLGEVTGVGTEKQTAAGKASRKVEAMVTQTEAATGKPKAKEAETGRVATEMPMEAGMVKLTVATAE